ncbi:hypothetical protein ACJX0J_041760, partial [Zea mays]
RSCRHVVLHKKLKYHVICAFPIHKTWQLTSKKCATYERFWNCVHYYFGAMFFMTACVPNQILLVTHLSPARKFALWCILTNFCHVKIVAILRYRKNVYLPLADHETITKREDNVMYLQPYAFMGRCKFFSFWRIQIWLAFTPDHTVDVQSDD